MPRENPIPPPLNREPTTVGAEIARASRRLPQFGATLAVIRASAGDGAAVRYLVDRLIEAHGGNLR